MYYHNTHSLGSSIFVASLYKIADYPIKQITLGVQSKEEQQRALQQCSDHQDLFSVYVRLIIEHAPTIYVFINITLVIWIAQTVFSSKLNSIPTSLYLISPYFTANPFSRIDIVPSSLQCKSNSQEIKLKSFPAIYSYSSIHKQLTKWSQNAIKFCGTTIPLQNKRNSCNNSEKLCSGYCVSSSNNCPITKIRITTNQTLPAGFSQIYRNNGKYYQISRLQSIPIVGIVATYQSKCANDQYYNRIFNNEKQFWDKVTDCGNEGKINTFFNQIDTMNTNQFFNINNIDITVTNQSIQQIELGYIPQFIFSKDPNKGCSQIHGEMRRFNSYLQKNSTTSQFAKSLLIIAFILLVSQIIWVICYYSIPGKQIQKNMVAAMLAVVQLTIIAFIYLSNLQLFKIQNLSKVIGKCIQQSVPAFKQWDFGIQSPQVFQMILFFNSAFLGLYLSALFFNYFCFEQYKRITVHLPRIQNNNII